MDIHKPKPFHSAREFLSEVAIIVLGVLIALGAEQTVQSFEWREKASRANEDMRVEIVDDDGAQAYQRRALSPCIEANLARLRDLVEQQAGRAEVLKAIGQYAVPRHTWDSVAFDAATANGVPAHLSRQAMSRWTYLYSVMPALDRADEHEFEDGSQLQSISRVGGALTESERTRVLQAVASLSSDNKDIMGHVDWVIDGMKSAGLTPGATGRRRALDELRRLNGADACVAGLEQLFAKGA